MPERGPQKSNIRRFETYEQRRSRRIAHYYIAPIMIASGIVLGGLTGLFEAQRVYNGDFDNATPQMKNVEGGENIPHWLPDVFNITLATTGTLMTGIAIGAYLETRDSESDKDKP
jgi:hypothetical protein